MAESRKGVFARNISSNLAGYLVSAAVALVLTPFVQAALGSKVWALWTLLIALTGHYGLLDFGVRSAVGQYVTRYWTNDDIDGVNRTLNTAMVLLVGVGVFAAVVTVALSLTLPMWVDMAEVDATALQWALLVTGLGIAVSLPMALWSTVTFARERFDIANGIGIAESLLRLGLTYAVLENGGDVLALALITTGTQLLACLPRMIVAYRLMPGLKFAPRTFTRESARELGGYGIYNFIVNAADKIVLSTDVIIIAAIMTNALVFYASGCLLIPYFVQLVLMVTWTMTPYATACDTRGDRDALRRLLLNGTRGSLFLASVIGAGLLLTGGQFLELWLLPETISSDQYADSAIILAILTWATLARASGSCGRQILFGMRRMRLLAGLSITEAALNLGLSLVLIRFYGLVGVAVGTLAPAVLLHTLAQNYLLVRLIGADPRLYVLQMLRACVPVMAAMALTSLWIDTWLVVDTWSLFVAKVLLLLVPAAAIGYLIVMNRVERHQLRLRLPFSRQH